MKYRFLGDSGLLVSQFGIGCFPFTDTPALSTVHKAYEILSKAYDHGVNFWDTAEIYGHGANEVLIGQVFRRGVGDKRWSREDLVITTKLFPGTKNGPNAAGLSRKHLVEGIKASLKRLELEYVDVLICHRPEPFTPIEETVRAMNFIIDQGWAFYWGTSEWLATEILEACEIADRLGLIRPICEQVQYNLLERSKVESDFLPLYKKYKMGLTTWSPLKYGLLTGKYANGIPEGSRLSSDHHAAVVAPILEQRVRQVEKLRPIAEELGCSIAQLALAWVTSNTNVSTMLLGATSLRQLEENVDALAIVPKLTEEVKAQIDMAIPRELKLATHDGFVALRKQYL